MRLGELDFHVDDWDSLPYRYLITLRDVLQKGLASPFWHAYREIVEGNKAGYLQTLANPSQAPSMDAAFASENTRGRYQATILLLESMQTFHDDVDLKIKNLQAQENYDERRTQQQSSESDTGLGLSLGVEPDSAP